MDKCKTKKNAILATKWSQDLRPWHRFSNKVLTCSISENKNKGLQTRLNLGIKLIQNKVLFDIKLLPYYRDAVTKFLSLLSVKIKIYKNNVGNKVDLAVNKININCYIQGQFWEKGLFIFYYIQFCFWYSMASQNMQICTQWSSKFPHTPGTEHLKVTLKTFYYYLFLHSHTHSDYNMYYKKMTVTYLS